MLNYIFELLAFIAATACYIKDDIKAMAIWLAATCVFGICGTIGDYIYKKYKSFK